MTNEYVSATLAKRCQKIWWTIHVLDRQMSALMGLPMAVRDEDITARLPPHSGASQKDIGLSLHVHFSNIISQISRRVYGVEGRSGKEYLTNTREILTQLAGITDQLNVTFTLSMQDSMAGISRMSAYLHLLHQQVRATQTDATVPANRHDLHSVYCLLLDHYSSAFCR